MPRNDASSVRPGPQKKHHGGQGRIAKIGQRNITKDERDQLYERRLATQRSIGHVGQVSSEFEKDADQLVESPTRNPEYGDYAEPELVEMAIIAGGITANAREIRQNGTNRLLIAA